MALTYDESAVLMNDLAFRGRIKVAALRYADTILNEANIVPAHNTRLGWAKETITQPDMKAGQLQPPVVNDTQVQQDGAKITDQALQTVVETVVNKLF